MAVCTMLNFQAPEAEAEVRATIVVPLTTPMSYIVRLPPKLKRRTPLEWGNFPPLRGLNPLSTSAEPPGSHGASSS
jgi:hypothetical protein